MNIFKKKTSPKGIRCEIASFQLEKKKLVVETKKTAKTRNETPLVIRFAAKMAQAIRYFQLNIRAKIPSVGLGTWQAAPGVVGNAVAIAIKIGFVLKKLFEDCVVKREDLWVTSNLWFVSISLKLLLNNLELQQ